MSKNSQAARFAARAASSDSMTSGASGWVWGSKRLRIFPSLPIRSLRQHDRTKNHDDFHGGNYGRTAAEVKAPIHWKPADWMAADNLPINRLGAQPSTTTPRAINTTATVNGAVA